MAESAATTAKAGKDFEIMVASLYRLLGFNTTHNVEVPGQQVDILATRRVPGIGEANLLIECKYLSRGTVSNQAVQDLLSTFEALRTKMNLTKVVMITNTDYSTSAKAISHTRRDIELLTVPDLKRHLIDSSQAFFAYAENYRHEVIFNQYVRLSGRGRLGRNRPEEEFSDVEGTLLQWIGQRGPGLISILGDYGTGKSTLLGKIKFELLSDAVSNAPIPLLFELRMMNRFDRLSEFIAFSVLQNLNISIAEELFFFFANEEMFLFLLDGFDEVSSQFDRNLRAAAMLKLSPLLSTRSKALLTCRPNYFMDIREYNSIMDETNVLGENLIKVMPKYPSVAAEARLQVAKQLQSRLAASYADKRLPQRVNSFTYGTIFLNPLTERQILEYLRKRQHEFKAEQITESAIEILTFLRSIYDISDLMTRPILLGMICDTILMGVIRIADKDTKIGASRLYEAYTNACFVRDFEKSGGARSPSPEQRGHFSEILAVSMLVDEADSVQFSRLLEMADALKQSVEGDDLASLTVERLAEAIRYTTFLEHVSEDRFSFKHYSFMEFFCARWIKNALKEGTKTDGRDPFFDRALKDEILYFLGSFAVEEAELVPRWTELLQTSCGESSGDEYRPSEVLYQRNALGALFYAGVALRRKTILGGHVWDVRPERVRLDEVKFREVTLSRVKFSFFDASMVHIERGVFRNCELIKCALRDCRWEVESAKTVFDETSMMSCRLALKSDDNVFRSCIFADCEVSLEGTVSIEGGEFRGDRIDLGVGSYKITDTLFESCDLFQGRDRGRTAIGVRLSTKKTRTEESVTSRFSGCSIWCLTVGPNVIASAVRDQEKGSTIQREMTVQPISVSWLTNNKGLIFVGGGGLRGRDFDRIKSEDLERYRAGESLTADQQRSWRRIAHNAMRLSTDGVLFVDLTLFEGFSLFRELVRNLLHERNVKVPDSVQREFFS